MINRTYTFQEISTSRTKWGNCPSCGKAVARSTRFYQTLNPFNKNADGSLKDVDTIRAEINREADEWQPDFTHNTARCQREEP